MRKRREIDEKGDEKEAGGIENERGEGKDEIGQLKRG